MHGSGVNRWLGTAAASVQLEIIGDPLLGSAVGLTAEFVGMDKCNIGTVFADSKIHVLGVYILNNP